MPLILFDVRNYLRFALLKDFYLETTFAWPLLLQVFIKLFHWLVRQISNFLAHFLFVELFVSHYESKRFQKALLKDFLNPVFLDDKTFHESLLVWGVPWWWHHSQLHKFTFRLCFVFDPILNFMLRLVNGFVEWLFRLSLTLIWLFIRNRVSPQGQVQLVNYLVYATQLQKLVSCNWFKHFCFRHLNLRNIKLRCLYFPFVFAFHSCFTFPFRFFINTLFGYLSFMFFQKLTFQLRLFDPGFLC